MAASWGLATEFTASSHPRKFFAVLHFYIHDNLHKLCELTLKHQLGILALTEEHRPK